MTEHGGPHLRYFDDDARDECLFIDRRVLRSGWWDPTALHSVVRQSPRPPFSTGLQGDPDRTRLRLNQIHAHFLQLPQKVSGRWQDAQALDLCVSNSRVKGAKHTAPPYPYTLKQVFSHLFTNSSFLPELPPLLHTFSCPQQGLRSTPSPLLSLVLENHFIGEYNLPLSSFLCVLPHSQHTYFHVHIPWCPAHSDTYVVSHQ